MNYTVESLPRARNDILGVFDRLMSHSTQGAQSWLDAFDRALDDLRESAALYPIVPQSRRLGLQLRFYLFQTPKGLPYQIIYGLDEATSLVRIYRVLSPGQRPPRRKDLF